MTVWLVNGRPGAIDPADRGLAYGDGVFETMAAEAGRIRWFDLHFQRLTEGCARLGIAPPDRRVVLDEIAAHCPPGRAVVKLIVTRGPGERGYPLPQAPAPTRILSISSWRTCPDWHYTRGIRLRTCELRLGENPALAGMKHLCRLEQVLAQIELDRQGAEEGVLLDSSGRVVSAISGNLFAVRGGAVQTPALTRCGVNGVMRRVVLATAAALELPAVELDMPPPMLQAADEIFVTNAVLGIRPVCELDGKPLAVGPITRLLMERLGYAPGA